MDIWITIYIPQTLFVMVIFTSQALLVLTETPIIRQLYQQQKTANFLHIFFKICLIILFGKHQNDHFLNITIKFWCIFSVNNIFLTLKPMLHISCGHNSDNVKCTQCCLFNVIFIFSKKKKGHWTIWQNPLNRRFAYPKRLAQSNINLPYVTSITLLFSSIYLRIFHPITILTILRLLVPGINQCRRHVCAILLFHLSMVWTWVIPHLIQYWMIIWCAALPL